MRVLHVVEATVGGVRRHIEILASGSDRRRFEHAVACPSRRDCSFGDDQFVPELQRAGIPVFPVAMSRAITPRADARALGRLITLIRTGQYDIVHTHSSKAGFLGRLAARIAGGPATIYTPHAMYFMGLSSPAKRRFYLAIERFVGRLGDCIVAVSPSERDIILHNRIAVPGRVVCIENGIAPISLPLDYDRGAWRRSLGQSTDSLLIGTVGNLSAQKNPWLFLNAAAQVLCDLPDIRFIWCGGGELTAAVQERAVELGIAHACRFLGHREDARQIMAALDLFWLTSDYEGLPYGLIEAMALQAPIVATDVVGSRDVVAGTAGLLVPPGDARALRAATVSLAAAPERRATLGQAAYARYLERYTADGMVRATEQLYEQLAGRRQAVARRSPTNQRA